MVSAQREYLTGSYAQAASALRRPEVVAPPIQRAAPKSQRRMNRARMSVLVLSAASLLVFGILSLAGWISQTREITRHARLIAEVRVADQRAQELALERSKIENDSTVAEQAAALNMVLPSERDAITIK